LRIRVSHTTRYDYSPPAKSAIQLLRLTPRSHEGQHVCQWRIGVDAQCRLKAGEDALGNITHSFTLEGPIQSFSVTVEGEVETQDTAGIVRGTVERFPPGLFLRTTPLTEPDDAILALAGEVRETLGRDPIAGLHDLSGKIHARMAFDTGATTTATKAGTALALGRAAAAGRGVDLDEVAMRARDGLTGPRRAGDIGFAVLRGGDVVGDHVVTFAGEGERIELAHRASSRRIYAVGAVRAALWARTQPPGRYGMRDVLGL